jgi:hypothetical protein
LFKFINLVGKMESTKTDQDVIIAQKERIEQLEKEVEILKKSEKYWKQKYNGKTLEVINVNFFQLYFLSLLDYKETVQETSSEHELSNDDEEEDLTLNTSEDILDFNNVTNDGDLIHSVLFNHMVIC